MNRIPSNIPLWFNSKDNLVSLYSSVRISRNFDGLNFPSHPEFKDHRVVNSRTEEVLAGLIASGNISVTDLSAADKTALEYLRRMRIIPEKKTEELNKMKLFYYSDAKTFILTNYMDHLTFFSHSAGTAVGSAYRNCSRTVDLFGKNSFAKDGKGNFLTASIDYFGSGLKCFSVLTVPCLRSKNRFSEIAESFGPNMIENTGFFFIKDNDLTTVTNRDSFSAPQKETLEYFISVLAELEKESRNCVWSKTEISKMEKYCSELADSENIAFGSLMEGYIRLSALKYAGCDKIKIPELNALLAETMLSGTVKSSESQIKKDISDKFREIVKKYLTSKKVRNKK
jgi:protein-arginine kinase